MQRQISSFFTKKGPLVAMAGEVGEVKAKVSAHKNVSVKEAAPKTGAEDTGADRSKKYCMVDSNGRNTIADVLSKAPDREKRTNLRNVIAQKFDHQPMTSGIIETAKLMLTPLERQVSMLMSFEWPV